MKNENIQIAPITNEDIFRAVEENRKLLLEILEQLKKSSLSYDTSINSYVSPPTSESGLHCDIERCKKTDAKHYRVRLEDGNGNLEIVEKNYCSAHFGEARAKGVEVIGI